MKRLEQLYDTTIKMLTILSEFEKNESDRETVIQQIDQLIQRRGELLKQIKAPYTDEELTVGKQIVQLNKQIKGKMDRIYDDVKDDMKKVKQKKDLNRSYINPYGQLKTTDGMYLDSKH